MALTGTTNTAANTALRYLAINNSSASSSLAKLSSGSRIVKASDDAASLAIGTKLKADVTALKQAAVNAGQATSLLQVADGGMARIGDILQRMKALAVQAQSGSVTDNERTFLNQEYQGLATQVTDIASQTKFNGSVLLSGGAGKTVAPAAGLATRGIGVNLSGAPANGTWTLAYTAASGTFTLDGPAGAGDTHTVQVDATAGIVFEGTINFETAGLSFTFNNFDDATNWFIRQVAPFQSCPKLEEP
jgi:flagellin